MRTTFLLVLVLLCARIATGQKFLQLEKVNSPKTRKYSPGHEITFQLSNKQWYTRTIKDISYQQHLILFAEGLVHVDSITALRSFKNRRWSRSLSNQLFNFAVVWAAYATVDEALQPDPFKKIEPAFYPIPALSTGTGLLIRHIFKKRTYYFKKNKNGEAKKWRLRLLDLNVEIKN